MYLNNLVRKMPVVACRKYFEIEVPNLYPSF